MDIADLSEVVKMGFASMRDDTKNEFGKVREEMQHLRGDLGDRISTTKDDLQTQISGLHYAREIDELRERITRLEEKSDLKPSRHAA